MYVNVVFVFLLYLYFFVFPEPVFSRLTFRVVMYLSVRRQIFWECRVEQDRLGERLFTIALQYFALQIHKYTSGNTKIHENINIPSRTRPTLFQRLFTIAEENFASHTTIAFIILRLIYLKSPMVNDHNIDNKRWFEIIFLVSNHHFKDGKGAQKTVWSCALNNQLDFMQNTWDAWHQIFCEVKLSRYYQMMAT